MAQIWGFAGYSGSGKTTAIECLENVYRCRRIYLGDYVLREVERQGLSQTPENERLVRQKVRETEGIDAFIHRASATILRTIDDGCDALIDAIYAEAEWIAVLQIADAVPANLVFIECQFETRAERLTLRENRSSSKQDLRNRDDLEREKLKFETLRGLSTAKTRNEGTLDQFKMSMSVQS